MMRISWDKPHVILLSEEAKRDMSKQELAFFPQEVLDMLTITDEERAHRDKWLKEGEAERKANPPRQIRIKELVCMLQGSVEGCIEFCYHPSQDRILERVMELKKEIEKIDG